MECIANSPHLNKRCGWLVFINDTENGQTRNFLEHYFTVELCLCWAIFGQMETMPNATRMPSFNDTLCITCSYVYRCIYILLFMVLLHKV